MTLAVLVLTMLTLGAGVALAHDGSSKLAPRPIGPVAEPASTGQDTVDVAVPATSISAVVPTQPAPWLAITALAGVLFVAMRRQRRLAALLLIVSLAVLAYETGVHSVHHAADPLGSRSCVIASASSHVVGVSVDAPNEAPVVLPTSRLIIADISSLVSPGCSAAHEGRAPPSAA